MIQCWYCSDKAAYEIRSKHKPTGKIEKWRGCAYHTEILTGEVEAGGPWTSTLSRI